MFSFSSSAGSTPATTLAGQLPAENVKKEEEKKARVGSLVAPVFRPRSALMSLRVGKGRQEIQSYRLPTFYSGTTTAATTYTSVISLTPSDSTEYSAIAALFDEIIVDSYDIVWVLGTEVAFTTQAPVIWGWAYDPISSAVISSTANIVQHTQHFIWGAGCETSAFQTTPQVMNKDGLFHWRVEVPKSGVRTQAGAAWFGHDWSSTSDTGDFYGFLKPYFKTLGATGVVGFEMIVTYNVRVRCRT